MPGTVLVDLDACKQKACSCSCGFEVSGNFISSLKFISICHQCSLGHSTTGTVTSEKGLGIEVLQPTQTKWHFLSLFFVGGIMPTPGWETSFYQLTPPLCFQAYETFFATAWPRSMFSLAIFIYLKFITSLSKLTEFCLWGTCFLQCLLSLWLEHLHLIDLGTDDALWREWSASSSEEVLISHIAHLCSLLGYQYQNRKWCEKC